MAGDEDEDAYLSNRRLNLKAKEREKDGVKWTEQCIGVWQKDVRSKNSKSPQICNGINIIHVYNKTFEESKMSFSRTRGIEIVFEDAEIKKNIQADEDIGSDGMIRAPRVKKQKDDNHLEKQPTLLENMSENFKEKYLNISKRMKKYQNDPATITELWTEFQDVANKQIETGKRILTYAKPAEKLTQLNDMFQQHCKELLNWFDGKSGNG